MFKYGCGENSARPADVVATLRCSESAAPWCRLLDFDCAVRKAYRCSMFLEHERRGEFLGLILF